MQGEHKGFTIDYDRGSRKSFVVQDIKGYYETLDGAEQGIDRHLKKNRNIDRLKIIKSLGYRNGKFVNAEITSITEDGRVWTVDEDGKREMINGGHFMCEQTGDNQGLIMKYIKMKAEGRKMMDDADELLLTTSRKSIDALIEKMTVKVG